MATLKDIAECAGVSISTVSRVLNGTAPISAKVKQQILSIAAEQGYPLHKLAKPVAEALDPLRHVLLAAPRNLMLESDYNLVSLSLINTLKTLCAQRNIRLRPFPSEHDAMTEEQMSASLQGMRQSGIVIVNDESIPLLQAVVKSGIPAVLINGEDPSMRLNRVTPANYAAAACAVRHLIEHGHRRILHLTWSSCITIKQRERGYRDALLKAGIAVDESLILASPDFHPLTARDAMLRWLSAHPDRLGVTAIFCAADNQAVGVVDALVQRGIRVPDDMSLVGMDNILPLDMLPVSLTTVHMPLDAVARATLQLLTQQLVPAQSLGVTQHVELAGHLVVRESVKCLSALA
ncbi:LacI family transcriptional regulator [Candidatus Symbiopectobacterium sp. 'North America']|uniref:LacI family DNA-binding transcriptional regulator n=1 Tax=Candidatus Symbiopectobacterium sp. 'North America' TaxID=2794574 RepID=UPI0018CA018B|nr:LacI family DNA-binding transcriptional regulator [Candidatus Symbiopectobacterium sp. 'North America']MBG6245807.1 LacI family transcriptional regulator [Candidatus Symbiopectobacterium sp. 'North America']